VPERSLSLAIGAGGQNARLAARLTGVRIDIASDGSGAAETPTEALAGEEALDDCRSCAYLRGLPAYTAEGDACAVRNLRRWRGAHGRSRWSRGLGLPER
jgi:hypothetical protein